MSHCSAHNKVVSVADDQDAAARGIGVGVTGMVCLALASRRRAAGFNTTREH